MGIIDDLKKWAHPYEDEDEEYEDDFPDLRDRGDSGAFAERDRGGNTRNREEDRRNKIVNIHATTQLRVVLVKPERFENASEIADHLKEKRTVVINLESTNKDVARRLIDFLSGGRGQDQEGRGQHLHYHAVPCGHHGRFDRRAGELRSLPVRRHKP